ncbi:alpha/beta hydrolase [Arthrobacter woluwensis]|uniref:Acetyl esterase n=1 Tax=Arthrobacter woluwensis TaxID=156980 RepID=A0A1H4NNE9_9MICC|nr:alpha/beta hydrolase [Arthrobacter woluwensis]SEB96806.1 acetyl esterase [Arthrobacter woluwensis]
MRWRRGRWRRPAVDPAVTAFEKAAAPLKKPEPSDAAGRRRVARENDDRIQVEFAETPLETATADHLVPAHDAPDVRVRVYWPGWEPTSPGAGLPVLVYCYGGGFTLGGIDWRAWDARLRRRAQDAGVIIVAPDYAHAPEHRFPVQPEQCWSALEWAFEHAEELGGSRDRIAVGGASSGGNLAAAVTLMNRDRNRIPVRLQILENPALDLTIGHADMSGIGPSMPHVILEKAGRALVAQYLGPDRALAREPYASPLLAESHEGLPPAVIFTAELDPLRGDGEAYARALSASGVPVTALRFVSQTHESLGIPVPFAAGDFAHRAWVSEVARLRE